MPLSKEDISAKASARAEKYKEVNQVARKEGLDIIEACKKVGISYSNYYRAKAEAMGTYKPKVRDRQASAPIKRKPKKITVTEIIPVAQVGMSFLIMGKPSDLAEFARAYV